MRFYQAATVRRELVVKASRPPRKARKVTETKKRQEALVKHAGNAVRLDLIDGITAWKSKVSAEKLAEAWRKGDYHGLTKFIPWDDLPKDLSKALGGIESSAGQGAKIQLETLPPNINKHLRFDVTNPELRHFLKNQSAALVTRVSDDTRNMIQNYVARSFTSAQTPRQVANAIKSGLGLLPRHQIALERYKDGLAKAGESEKRVAELGDKYEAKLLDYRAMMIARTETRTAVNHGQLSVWREGAKRGLINRETAQKEWATDGDPCPVCDPMDGERVLLDESWTIEYENGETAQVQVPTESHPSCMCSMELVFNEEEAS